MKNSITKRIIKISFILGIVLIISLLFSFAVGSVHISWHEILILIKNKLTGKPLEGMPDETIIFQIRIPRALLAVLVGASLSVAGVAFQGLLRNPLADPYIIGASAGAALGATLAMILGFKEGFLGIAPVTVMAFAGSIITIFVIYRLAVVESKIPVETFLLAGVVVGSFIWAVISFIVSIAGEKLSIIVLWLMGSLADRSDWIHLAAVFPFFLLGSIILFIYSHKLNILTLGEEQAAHLGINVERMKLVIIIAASLVTSAAVSVSGLIGFVGLMIPHIVRMITGADHRTLLPASALAGGIFLLLADNLSRSLLPWVSSFSSFSSLGEQEIPVGVITAIIGAPFFFYLLYKRRKK